MKVILPVVFVCYLNISKDVGRPYSISVALLVKSTVLRHERQGWNVESRLTKRTSQTMLGGLEIPLQIPNKSHTIPG